MGHGDLTLLGPQEDKIEHASGFPFRKQGRWDIFPTFMFITERFAPMDLNSLPLLAKHTPVASKSSGRVTGACSKESLKEKGRVPRGHWEGHQHRTLTFSLHTLVSFFWLR